MDRPRLAILITLLIATTPAMATDITGIPRIVDGDTVQIDATKIRLTGIDAPETDQVCPEPANAGHAVSLPVTSL